MENMVFKRKIYSQPIEVKSSGYKTHASLDAFCQKFSDRIVHLYLVYTKDLQKDGKTLLVPIYMPPILIKQEWRVCHKPHPIRPVFCQHYPGRSPGLRAFGLSARLRLPLFRLMTHPLLFISFQKIIPGCDKPAATFPSEA